MTYYFCTLFDKNFLFKGLALYRSLINHCADFRLWVLCMDELTYKTLETLNLKHATLLRLRDFEDEKLLAVKPSRTVAEYSWTCTSSLLWYLLQRYPEMSRLAYVDADLFFFSSPEPIYQELGNNSVYIIPHRFAPDLKYLERQSGVYNVGLVLFRNNEAGRKCLFWWRNRCLEWCYDRIEDGRYGDQMYLNDWPTRFSGIAASQNLGVGAGPWNIGQYELAKSDDEILVSGKPLVFFHFHALAIYTKNEFEPHKLLYEVPKKALRFIYGPYVEMLKSVISQVKQVRPDFNFGFTAKPPIVTRFKRKLIKLRRIIKK